MHLRGAQGRQTRIALWLAISALGATVAGLIWFRSPEERLRRHSAQVLAGIVPGFGLYVDERHCAECHPDQAASHPLTGHAQTFGPTAESKLAAALDKMTFLDRERSVTYHYHFDQQAGLSVTAPQRFGGDSFPLAYAVGSGKRRLTFYTLIPNRVGGTAAIEHRVSVRSARDGPVLELTPGHQGLVAGQQVEHFGRVLEPAAVGRCVECHATRGEIRGEEIRGLASNVGCQKCHWPGREHVIAMREAQARGESVAGGVKPGAIEQIRACQRCHLPSGDEELKSMPDHIRSVRVQSAELLESRCFTQSNNRLRCSTCHDPHAPIGADPAPYVQGCLECHGAPNAVKCPVSPTTDCVRCHMPVVTAEGGARWHDHRMRKKPPAAK